MAKKKKVHDGGTAVALPAASLKKYARGDKVNVKKALKERVSSLHAALRSSIHCVALAGCHGQEASKQNQV